MLEDFSLFADASLLYYSFVPQIGCRFWDLALREHASTNKVANNIHVLTSNANIFFLNAQLI